MVDLKGHEHVGVFAYVCVGGRVCVLRDVRIFLLMKRDFHSEGKPSGLRRYAR